MQFSNKIKNYIILVYNSIDKKSSAAIRQARYRSKVRSSTSNPDPSERDQASCIASEASEAICADQLSSHDSEECLIKSSIKENDFLAYIIDRIKCVAEDSNAGSNDCKQSCLPLTSQGPRLSSDGGVPDNVIKPSIGGVKGSVKKVPGPALCLQPIGGVSRADWHYIKLLFSIMYVNRMLGSEIYASESFIQEMNTLLHKRANWGEYYEFRRKFCTTKYPVHKNMLAEPEAAQVLELFVITPNRYRESENGSLWTTHLDIIEELRPFINSGRKEIAQRMLSRTEFGDTTWTEISHEEHLKLNQVVKSLDWESILALESHRNDEVRDFINEMRYFRGNNNAS